MKISEVEIDNFSNKCCDAIRKYFANLLDRAYTLKDIALLFSIERPTDMPEAIWVDIQKKLSASYISKYIGDLYVCSRKSLSVDDISCPDFISSSDWKKIQADLGGLVTGNIINEIFNSKWANVPNICEDMQSNGLPNSHKETIINVAISIGIYKSWFRWSDDDAQKLLNEIDSYHFVDVSAKEPIVKFCQFIIEMYGKRLELSEKETLLSKKESEATVLKIQLDNLNSKVTKQLQTIDLILSGDHDFLDKIEDYNMPFSPGNEANLRIVATLLRDKICT